MQASRDQNFVPTLLGVSSSDGVTPVTIYADPVTHRLLVDFSGAGSGNVTGPLSSTDSAIALFDGTTGEIIKNSVVTIDVNGAITIAGNYTLPYVDGTIGQTLQTNGAGTVTWSSAGSGDVSGPVSSTDGVPALFNGTTGKVIKNSTPTGTGNPVLQTSPSLITPALGVATATSINKLTITQPATGSTLTIADGKILTASNTLTFTGTDSSSVNFGGGGTVLYSTGTIPLTVGNTTIASGTTTRILYDNAGTLGEYTITGTGTVVAMATAPTFVTSITTPSVLATANDSGALGASGTAFSDLFLASGAVVNFAAGDYTLTHSAGILTANKDLQVTTVGTNSASVVTVGGTQTLTNKTLTAPKIADSGYIADPNGNRQITFVAASSAVNYFTFQNSSTTFPLSISASGTDTNINLQLAAKGSGSVQAKVGASYADVVTTSATQTLTGKSIVASQITTGTFGTGAYTMDTRLTVPQIFNTPATITVTTNAGTVTRANRINNFTNSSAAGMTITMSTTGATDGDMVMVVILDASAVAQTITWVNTENSNTSVPTTSNGSTTLPLTVGFKWNAGTSKWRCIAST